MAGIPRPASYADAKRRLAESLALWLRWSTQEGSRAFEDGPQRLPSATPPHYSYVRAQQLATGRVAFTLFDVERGRVVLRAYVTADPDHLSSFEKEMKGKRDIATLWVERGGSLGAHAEGAPLRTIDELYASCSATIAAAEAGGDTPPLLYFHPDGILMRCGDEISVQDFSQFSLAHETVDDHAERWVCASEQGPKLPNSPLLYGSQVCRPAFVRDPNYLVKVAAAREARRQEACAQGVLACEEFEQNGASATDICQIEPQACGYREPYAASWGFASGFDACFVPVLAHKMLPLEIGKLQPKAEWSFPVVNGTICGLGDGYFGPVRPLRLRYVPNDRGDFRPTVTR